MFDVQNYNKYSVPTPGPTSGAFGDTPIFWTRTHFTTCLVPPNNFITFQASSAQAVLNSPLIVPGAAYSFCAWIAAAILIQCVPEGNSVGQTLTYQSPLTKQGSGKYNGVIPSGVDIDSEVLQNAGALRPLWLLRSRI